MLARPNITRHCSAFLITLELNQSIDYIYNVFGINIQEKPVIETTRKARPSAEQTRVSLISSGLRLFGERGFEATSTRHIAADAGANIASIAYHFGGKEGLRLACAETVVDKFREMAGPLVLASDPGENEEYAVRVIETALVSMIRFFTAQPEARDIAAFVMREMIQPGAVIDLIYREMMFPFHSALCRLWGVATHQNSDSPATRLAVFAVIGQVIYFRLGQPVICRRMGWKAVGPKEADQIIAVITGNLRALVLAAKDD